MAHSRGQRGMTAGSWTDVLDTFEARLAAQQTALDAGGTTIVPPFEPPATIPPLPVDLAERAIALTERCRRIEADIARALETAGAALARATATKINLPAEPVYFDSRV